MYKITHAKAWERLRKHREGFGALMSCRRVSDWFSTQRIALWGRTLSIIQSLQHQGKSASWLTVVCVCVCCVSKHSGDRCVSELPIQVTLSHLNGRFLVDTEQGDVGHTDEGPLFVGPEHDDRASLRSLGGDVEVGKANAAQVRGQTYEDVPVGAKRSEPSWHRTAHTVTVRNHTNILGQGFSTLGSRPHMRSDGIQMGDTWKCLAIHKISEFIRNL